MLPIAVGQNEILIVGALILILFGTKKLPELGRSLAEGIQEFKRASRKAREDEDTSEPKQS
jgi:sec-independent protein translocase protein TatA